MISQIINGKEIANQVKQDLKTKIEKLLSEILSDKYEMNVTLRFEKMED